MRYGPYYGRDTATALLFVEKKIEGQIYYLQAEEHKKGWVELVIKRKPRKTKMSQCLGMIRKNTKWIMGKR